MNIFEVHSNESECIKSGRLGLEQGISLLMHAAVLPIFFWKIHVFITSFPFWIYTCNISPNLQRDTLLIYVPNGSRFLKNMSSVVNIVLGWYKIVWHSLTHLPFFTQDRIFLRGSLNPSITPWNFQKLSIHFNNRGGGENWPKQPEFLNSEKKPTHF